MKIEVTEKNIQTGLRHNHQFCPIALAVKDSIPCHIVSVGAVYIHIDGEDYPLPIEGMIFVQHFDRGFSVSPFSFQLDIPTSLGDSIPVNDFTTTCEAKPLSNENEPKPKNAGSVLRGVQSDLYGEKRDQPSF